MTMQSTIPQWLADKKASFMSDEDAVSFEVKDLGLCRIDIHREPGDLYDSWEIFSESNGKIFSLPDASYGNATKDEFISEFTKKIRHIYEVETHYNRNGHSELETLIYEADGRLLASRGN